MFSRLRRLRPFLAHSHVLLLACALFVYLSFATGYTWRLKPGFLAQRDYFALQADAFLQGRLDLAVPSPLLDMSPYNGRIYLYWGPANSLLPFLLKLVTGRDPGMIVWTVLYCLLGLAFFSRTMALLRGRYFPALPPWALPAALGCLAFGSPVGYLAAWGTSFHNESIALSFAAQMALVLAWMHLLSTGSIRSAFAFGAAAALAVATRMTNLFLLPGLFVPLLWGAFTRRTLLRQILIPGAVISVGIAGLMLYNAARFEDPFETGMRHATGFREQRTLLYEKGALLSPRWFPLNFRLYFLTLPPLREWLPDLTSLQTWPIPPALADLFPSGHPLMSDMHSVLFMTPVLLLGVLLGFARLGPEQRRLCVGLALALAGVLLFLLFYAWSARRFTVDFVPLWILLAFAALGAFLERYPRREHGLRDVVLLLLFWSVAVHFPLMRSGGRKFLSLLASSEDQLTRPHDVWPALLTACLGLALYLEIYRLSPEPPKTSSGSGKDAPATATTGA